MIENIEQWMVSRLDTIENLTGQNFPTVSPTGDEEPPFCLYTLVSETSEADLSGGDDIRRAKVQLALFDNDNDRLNDVTRQARKALRCEDVEADDLYIYGTSTTLHAKDFDMRLDMHVQPVIADVVYWQKE